MARLGVGLFMLILSFIGLIVTSVETTAGWNYWRWIVPFYAASALWLSWYLRKNKQSFSLATLWHELLHWVGLISAIFLISMFVKEGIVGRLEASLSMLTLMALGIFLAGIYIETTFLFIGIALGAFAATVAFIDEYLYAFTIPFLLLAAGAIGWITWHHHHKKTL